MSKFDDIFNSKTLLSSKLLIKRLNEDLPQNLKYVISDDEQELILVPEGKITLSNFEFDYPEEFLKLNNGVKDEKKLKDYCKNMMKPLKVTPLFGDFFKINDKDFDTKKVVLDKYGNTKLSTCDMYIGKEEKDNIREFTLSNGEYSQKIIMKQIPNNSITTTAFMYKEDNYFRFMMYIDNYQQKITFKFTSNMGDYPNIIIGKRIESWKESFMIGDLLIDGFKLSAKTKVDSEYVNYHILEKMEELEKTMKIKFEFPLGNIKSSDINNILLLYASIVKKYSIFKGIVGTLTIDSTNEMPTDFLTMKKMAISLCKDEEIVVCNNIINVFGCYVYQNLTYNKHEKSDDIYKYYMKESDSNGISESVRFFVSEYEYEIEENNNKNLLSDISNSKAIEEIYR